MRTRCLPKLSLEFVEVKDTPEFADVIGACSEGLPLRTREFMAHLCGLYDSKVNGMIHGNICQGGAF
uniref:Uncharacterized protein n=1 Tax=Rhizophora mucronata TaxID=61149 RepID=A0A2P2LL75_RHIMU